MKTKLLILSGVFALIIVAGAVFFLTEANSAHHAIYLDNMEALARGESGVHTNYTCYESTEPLSSTTGIEYEYKCTSGTTLVEAGGTLKRPYDSYACEKDYAAKVKPGSKVGECFISY